LQMEEIFSNRRLSKWLHKGYWGVNKRGWIRRQLRDEKIWGRKEIDSSQGENIIPDHSWVNGKKGWTEGPHNKD